MTTFAFPGQSRPPAAQTPVPALPSLSSAAGRMAAPFSVGVQSLLQQQQQQLSQQQQHQLELQRQAQQQTASQTLILNQQKAKEEAQERAQAQAQAQALAQANSPAGHVTNIAELVRAVEQPKPSVQADLNLKLMCRDCKDPVPNIVEDFSAGDLVCGNCGLILGNRIIDTRSEWRTFSNSDDNSDDPSRVGGVQDPLLGNQQGLDSTIIAARDGGSGKSRILSRVQQKAVTQKGEAGILQAFKNIQAMGERISLSKIVIDSTKQLFKRADDEKLVKGKPTEAIIAACLYIACKEHGDHRTFKEICALSKVPKKEIGKYYKALQPLFENKQPISLESYVSRFASALDIKQEVRKAAMIVVNRASEAGTLAGKSPISLVASCLYFVCCLSNDPKLAKVIADVAGCTESTLKNSYRILYESREILGSGLALPLGIDKLPM